MAFGRRRAVWGAGTIAASAAVVIITPSMHGTDAAANSFRLELTAYPALFAMWKKRSLHRT